MDGTDSTSQPFDFLSDDKYPIATAEYDKRKSWLSNLIKLRKSWLHNIFFYNTFTNFVDNHSMIIHE
jgi:hypothetical protein